MTFPGARLGIVRALVAGVMLLAAPRAASADWLLTPFFGWTFAGDTTLLDLEFAAGNVHTTYGLAVTQLGNGPLGFEAYFHYVPGFFDDPRIEGDTVDVNESSRSAGAMANVVLAMPVEDSYGLRPFLSGGIGVLTAVVHDRGDTFSYNKQILSVNLGGGAIGFLSDSVGLRFDLRYFRNLRNQEDLDVITTTGQIRLRYWTGSIGLVLRR